MGQLSFPVASVLMWAAAECGARGVPEETLRDASYLVGKMATAGASEDEARAAVTNLLDLRHGRKKAPAPPPVRR